MLGKLAYRNTKRNIKDYLIYLITVTASFSLIFAFNLVANSDEIVKLCSSMDAFKNSLFAGHKWSRFHQYCSLSI